MPKGMGLAALRVLQAIAGGAEYGLDIVELTGLPSGTVYPALSRHERDGYVRSSWEDAANARRHGRPQRRYYRVTPQGRRAISDALAGLGVEPARTARIARAKSHS